MRVRPLLILTGIVSSILGALVVYLMLSVPNDLRADALLKEARKHITDGNDDKARQSLAQVVQQYPRTDAAAAATVALVSLDKKERDQLQRAINQLRTQNEQQSKLIADLQQSVTTINNRPPQVVTVQAPAPKPPATKAAPKKRTPPKKRRR
jgi:thioredoxin-like negative regulator of GroEL